MHVHVLGNLDSPEMETVRRELARANCTVTRSTSREPLAVIPDLIVVCQHWPDEFSSREVHALLAEFPLARLVCCYGPWCDADGRNRDLWPTGSRVPVVLAPARLRLESAVVQGAADIPILPLTASRTELFEAMYAGAEAESPERAVAVESPDRAWRTMIETALRSCGSRIVSVQAAEVVVFDFDPGTAEQEAALLALTGNPKQSVIVLVGLLTSDVSDRARQRGAAGVLAKLAPLTSLTDMIREVSV